jgi:putative phage-type endonuclease
MSITNILDYANILEDFTNVSYEEWSVKRKAQIGIGGSDAGTLLGLNSFKDEYTLYLEKIGEIVPSEAGEAAEWGHTLEPVVADKWLERYGKNLGITIEPFNYLLQSITHPFMLANIDRLIRKGDDFGILEVKTASEYLNGEWEHGEILHDGSGNGKVPAKYYAQLQHYFHVTGLKWGWFCALVGGNKLYSVYVERNDAFIEKLIEIEMLFTQRLEHRIPPEINGSDTCKELVGRLYKEHNEVFEETDDEEFGGWLLLRNELKEQIDLLKEEHSKALAPLEDQLAICETSMKARIGENKGVTYQGWKVTWGVRAGRKTADINLLEEKYPEIAQEVIKQGESYRQISVAKPKAKKGAKA